MKKAGLDAAARWIWTGEAVPNSMVAARGTLLLRRSPASATLRVFADTKYKLYVNNHFVNAGPAPFRKPVVQVDAHDVTAFLHAGTNTVLILAHFIGSDVKYNLAEKPGVIASLEAALPGGGRGLLVTDESWRVADLTCWNRRTPRRNWALEHIEDLDLAEPTFAILAQYAAADYAAAAGRPAPAKLWRRPAVIERPDLELRARAVPPLAWTIEQVGRPCSIFRTNTERYNLQDTAVRLDHEHVWPEWDERVYEMTRDDGVRLARREGDPGYALLYDMRRNCAGEPAVEVECEAACTLDVAMAEQLRSDGHPVIWRNGGLYYSRYHLQPGPNRIRFYHFNGYRYLYLVLKDCVGTVHVRRVTTHHCRADLAFRDMLACNDATAESLYRISRRSLALNAQADTYDCNTREQGTYWGDSLWVADSIGHQSGDFRHMRHLCHAMSDEFKATGMLNSSLYGLGQPLYDYCLVPVDLLARYHRYTADLATVRANVGTAAAIVAQFRAFRDPDGLLSVRRVADATGGKGLLFLDHPGNGWHPMTTTGIDRGDCNAGFNLFYLQALQALDRLETACGRRSGLAAEIRSLTHTLRERFRVREHGLVADAIPPTGTSPRFSQITNALAIMTGVLTGEQARHALATVLDLPRHPWVSQGTPYSYFFLADAASRTGQADLAVRAFCRDFAPMLTRGATTTWEAWNADNHDSLNHAWSAPLPLLIRCGVMGLSPLTAGYHRVGLSPQLPVFDSFRGSCCIPQGMVEMSWERMQTDIWQFEVTLPRRLPGVLHIPGLHRRAFRGTWKGVIRISVATS